MNNIKKGIVAFLMLLAFFYWMGSRTENTETVSSQAKNATGNITYDETFVRNMADSVGKQLPRKINRDVQATTVTSVGKKIIYKYNLINVVSEGVDIKSVRAQYYSNAINAASTTPDVLNAINNGVLIEYQLYDKNNKYLTSFVIGSSDLKK